MLERRVWIPAVILGVGLVAQLSRPAPVEVNLRQPLTGVPDTLMGYVGTTLPIDSSEVAAAGTTAYLNRKYVAANGTGFLLYIGFHAAQTQENQVHSPRSCLPGAGWQVLTAERRQTAFGSVNRNLLELNGTRAIVVYWYQGRGRLEADEFSMKLQLIRDAVMTGRTEESMVRIVIPVRNAQRPESASFPDEQEAERLALQVAANVAGHMNTILP
jgi:EpsI family protein